MRRQTKSCFQVDHLELRRLLSTIYVSNSSAAMLGNNSGTSWVNAYTNLQTALGNANSGDTIEVGQGTYKPGTQPNKTFAMENGVSILGGYAGTGQSNPDARSVTQTPSILSGDIGGAGDNSYHVVYAGGVGSTAVLDGFTVTGGNPSGNGAIDGGGISLVNASPTINDCIITGNTASFGGGGLYAFNSTVTLSNCTLSGNTASTSGAAIYGRSSTLELTDCTITQNISSSNGGGILTNGDASDVITDCTFTGNQATFDGGGIDSINSSATLTNCIFVGNTASDGSGVDCNQGASVSVVNCTFSDNTGNSGGAVYAKATSTATITNSILWDDSPNGQETSADGTSSISTHFNDVTGAVSGVNNNMDTDPKFARAPETNGASDYGDLHLQPDSPVINVGSNSAISGTSTDADSKLRIVNGTVDLGAYEYQLFYVDASATGSHNGSSWANAFTDLQSALADAVDGTTINVAQGTYHPTSDTNTSATFQLIDGVRLYGGFAGDTTNTPGTRDTTLYPTVLSGDIGTPNNISDNSNNVVTGSGTDSTAVLDGFTITDGNAKGGSGKQYGGGGIYDNDGSPTINDCIITGNQSSVDSGGGVYNVGGSSPMITNTTISNNSAFSVGGGIDNRNGSPTLINCSITGNTARAAGAGVYDYAATTFIDCLIAGNTTTGINGNSATGNGGGIYTGNTGVLTLINCTVAQNSAPHVGGIYNQSSSAPIITNSILWGDSPNEITSSRAPNITYSDIDQSGFAGSNHNIDVDPLFANGVAGGNFRVMLTSPVVNVGLNSAIAGTNTDLDGSPRITNGTVDLGPYEILSTIFVDANATGANNGSSWTDAFTTLTAALSLASPESGQTIDVAQGTYKPTTTTDRTASFDLVADVSLYGGFAGATTANPGLRDPSLYPSILSGEIGAAGISDNSYHVVYAKYASIVSTAKLDGFTVTGGNADGNTFGHYDEGGGILISSCNPTINDCIISGNSATDDGGGIYFDDVTTTLTNCVITGNTARKGGGVAGQSSRLTLIDSIIGDNSAGAGGGIYDGDVGLTLTNCTITGNTATSNGGGINGSISTETLTNCILWGDTAQTTGNEIYSGTSDAVTVTFSDIDQSGYAGSNNNIDIDPQFVDPAQHNYHIKVVSPAANVGLNSAIAGTDTDLDGNPRIINGTVDMGAYETRPIIYVDASATGTNDGTGFANAYTTLTAALAHATFNSGETIYVAQGTYKPTTGADRSASFGLIDGVGIDGGFAGDTTANPGQRDVALFTTILSGDIGTAGDNSDNSYHVVYVSGVNSTAVLDGFTITHGNADGNASPENSGGGILVYSGNPAINDCTITGNIALTLGGGIANFMGSQVTLTDCTISGNTAFAGGGVADFYSTPTVTDCIITGNSSTSNGGGIDNFGDSLTLIDTIITANTAAQNGGGMYSTDHNATAFINCLFAANTASVAGAIFGDDFSSSTLTNCTLSGNTATSTSSAIYDQDSSSATLTNSIVWANTGTPTEVGSSSDSSITITYSDIDQGGYAGSNHNIESDPKFVRPVGTNGASDYGDLRLQSGSPAVNAGSNAAIANGITTDLAGNGRIVASTVDLGAYELTSTQLVFSTQPLGNIAAGAALPVIVDIEDSSGNIVTTDDSTVTIQIATGPGGASLHGALTAVAHNGVATFSGLTITQTGPYTVSVSDGSLTGITSNSFNISPSVPTLLSISQQPSAVTAGQDIPLTVQVKDSLGNLIDGTSVTVAITSASSTETLNGTTTRATTGGIANFTDLTIDQAGTYSFTITDGSLPAVTSSDFAINAASAAQLAFNVEPTNTLAGQAMAAFAVAIEDRFGNIVSNDNSTVSLTSAPAGITASAAANDGIAAFTNLSTIAAGSYTLSAADGSLTSATSSAFNIAAAAPAQLVISQQPASGVAGQDIPLTVEVMDQFGNLADGSSITLAIATGPAGAALGGTITLPTTSGIAAFNNVTLDRAGAFTLTAADGSLAAVTTSSFNITYAGNQLVFTTEPANAAAGVKLGAIKVSPENTTGNPLTTNKSKIKLTLSSGGKLLGKTTASVKNGVAVFSGLAIQKAGTYTLTATDPTFASAISTTFTITGGAAKKIAFNPQPGNVTASTPFNVAIELVDKYGNAVNNGSTVDLTLGSHPKTAASLNLSTTVSDGFADFDNVTLATAGNYTLVGLDGKIKATSKKFVVS